MSGYRVTCQECGRRYVPTRREVQRVIVERKERDWVCIHCWLGKRWRGLVYLLGAIVLAGALLCSLTGCGLNGGWGPGPASDGEQQELEIEKIRRERGASKVAQREAERKLQRMIGSR